VTLLGVHGITRVYWSACSFFSVISIAEGLTVWCDRWDLHWRIHGKDTVWPAADTEGAAGHLAALVNDRQS
jgi:hypothetical protein